MLGVGEGLDRRRRRGARAAALRVDRLHLLAGEVGRRPRVTEDPVGGVGDGGERPAGQQLEVGHPGGRAVLGRRHGTILPASVPWPDARVTPLSRSWRAPRERSADRPSGARRRDRAQQVRRRLRSLVAIDASVPSYRRSATSRARSSRSCNKPIQALGMAQPVSTCRRPARPGLPSTPTVPHRRRTTDPRHAGLSRGPRPADAARLPATTTQAQALIHDGRQQGAVPSWVAGKRAAMLATCAANGWPTRPTATRTTRCSKRSRRPSPS